MIKSIYNRPITYLMLTITIIIFGIVSLFKLPVNLMPSGGGDVLSIVTSYSGVSPEQIEKIVTVPIENAIGGIEGIQKIYSISEESKSKIYVYFFPGKNTKYSALRIREAVFSVSADFPRACEKPYIMKNDPDDRPVFIFNIKSEEMSLNELRVFAEKNIKKDLSMIDGISEIEFSGGSIKEIHVDVDPAALVAYELQITELSSILQNAYFVNSQGKIKEYNKDTILYTDARFTSINEIQTLPVHYDEKSKKLVMLKDIADVYEGVRQKENISRVNGDERVSIYIKKSGDANTLKVCNELLTYINKKIKNNIKFEIIYNQGEYISRAIGNVKDAGIIGGIIAILVLFIFINNFKAIILISFSIPFSIVLTFFLMYLLKIEINVMTLSGFALGIGMLLDNGIVMIQSLSEDLKYKEWIRSDRTIAPIISSTLTTVAIFFPITFVNYEFRKLYGGLALTVTFSLISSIICAVVIIPAGYGLFSKIFRKRKDFHHTKFSIYLEKTTMHLLKRIWKKANITATVIILLILSIPIIIIRMDKEYIDPASGSEITAYVEMEAGTSLDETERIVRKVEKIYREDENVKRVNSRIQKWHADIDIKYEPKKFRSQEEFIQYLKKKTDIFKDCFVHYEEKGSTEGRIINVDIIGDNGNYLRELAFNASKVVGEVKGIRNVVLKFKEGKPSLTWKIDRGKCQNYNVPIISAGEQLRWAIFGPVALKYIKDNREMDLRISFPEKNKKSLEDINDMIVKNTNNENIYIKELGDFEYGAEPGKIYRKNKRKTVSIGIYLGKISLSKAIPKIKKALKEISLNEGYYFDFGDILQKLKESQQVALFALFLSIFMIYCILSIQFESFVLPFLIIPVIPISACFSIMILFILKMSLNLAVYIGLIILAGVVVNNTILITEGIVNSKVINIFSIYKIVKTRIKPVFITTTTTVLALIPMIIKSGEGSELWKPLAITLLTGLIFGTFLNLCLFPVIFLIYKRK